MRILITGICGFVGNALAQGLCDHIFGTEIIGLDNLSRRGSERNLAALSRRGVKVRHGDIRAASDLEMLENIDWIIDAAANPSVLAGVLGSSSRQLLEHNLLGTINLLELCKKCQAGFILLSTSRVYSIPALAAIQMDAEHNTFQPRLDQNWPTGCSPRGVTEEFSTRSPLSLYGASKLASEVLAMEYAAAFGFPVRINRCGVMAGAGQFGRVDQGIFSYWIHSYAAQKPLRYIGFDATGRQVRDCLHPRDLVPLVADQMRKSTVPMPGPLNVGGGLSNSMSLAQLTGWCAARFGQREIEHEPVQRPFDIPWLVLDSSAAEKQWGWRVQTPLQKILEEIAEHAGRNADWLESTGA